jgi:hypothetical protein
LKNGIGGPLLDPKISTQTIRFAITKSQPDKTEPANKWNADQFPSTKVFSDLFFDNETKKPDPASISGGEEIITWYSITVENRSPEAGDEKPFEGTVLIHGLYFAHNIESSKNPFAETKKELQKPEYKKPTWLRSPNGK